MHSGELARSPIYHGSVFDVDWGTVSTLGALMAACFGYLARQMNRLDDKLSAVETRVTARIDQLTERYIRHLERHPH